MLSGAVAISLLVFSLYIYALYGRRRSSTPVSILLWGGGIVFPIITLASLLTLGVPAGSALAPDQKDPDAFRVEITGHQWWWEVIYRDDNGLQIVSANEVHVPAGRPVHFLVRSGDVIHSYWIPRLGGKVDAIPGVTNVLSLQASTPGIYRGTCSEFCGAQHARMSFIVVAHEEERLREKLAELAHAGPEPVPAFRAHCAACHSLDPSLRSPRAQAPNLAHVGSRRTLGAGALANGPGSFRTWILRHQDIKPGNRMPVFHGSLAEAEISAITAMLERTR